MDSQRKTALTVGVLFILTFITSIAAVFAYGPALTDANYVNGARSVPVGATSGTVQGVGLRGALEF